MASRNIDTIRQAHQAFNQRDFDQGVASMSEDVTYHDRARGETYRGRDGFKEFMKSWVESFSDAEVAEPTYHDAGDTVIAEYVGRGVNDGAFGSLPPTEKELNLRMCEVLRFDEEGRVVSGNVYYDRLQMMTQLGHMEPAEAAPAR